MRRILSEKNLVVVLFIMVLVIFSLAQEDTEKIERMYQNANSPAVSLPVEAQTAEAEIPAKEITNNSVTQLR